MNKLITGVLILLSVNTIAQTDEFLLDTDAAGPFKRNMLMDQSLKIASAKYQVEKTSITLEGMESVTFFLVHMLDISKSTATITYI